ncbi:MAG: DUF1501 domain-containing protein, partial [Deltaproteobacteria bacterium]|nr:DUF1501 domain-containing protein [Deltaproteobacteria bacterium]
TSSRGEPVNVNAPGSYVDGAENNPDPDMAPTDVYLGGKAFTGAKPWAELPLALRERLQLFHHVSYTNAHIEYPKALECFGAVRGEDGNGVESLPSAIAQECAGLLDTIQVEPVDLRRGHRAVRFMGNPIPQTPPSAIVELFGGNPGQLDGLADLRDQHLDQLHASLREDGTDAERRFLDRYALGRSQAKAMGSQLGSLLSGISPGDDGPTAQAIAAVAMMKLNLSPVILLHFGFGGDNHKDEDLSEERLESVPGIEAIGTLWNELVGAGLEDRATFATFDVFGRTLVRNDRGGRDHQANHHVMAMFGPRVRAGVVGGVHKVNDGNRPFSARPIDSASGVATDDGDVGLEDSLTAAAATLAAATGVDAERIQTRVTGGTVVTGALTG